MFTRVSALLAVLLLGACATYTYVPAPREPGPWTGKTFYGTAREVGQSRFSKTLNFADGSRIEFKRNPYGRACSRIWQYDYLPHGRLAGPPQSMDVCP
jgi:hypothetical protein